MANVTLGNAVTRVRLYLDDDDGKLGDADVVKDALRVAQAEVWQLVVAHGWNGAEQEASLSTSAAGVADLSALAPLKLVGLYEAGGSGFLRPIPPARRAEGLAHRTGVRSLKVVYVPRVALPATDEASFVWGHANVDAPIFDDLMVFTAVKHLKAIDAETNPALERRLDDLRATAVSYVSLPQWRVLPMGYHERIRRSGLFYVVTAPDTLQLVA